MRHSRHSLKRLKSEALQTKINKASTKPLSPGLPLFSATLLRALACCVLRIHQSMKWMWPWPTARRVYAFQVDAILHWNQYVEIEQETNKSGHEWNWCRCCTSSCVSSRQESLSWATGFIWLKLAFAQPWKTGWWFQPLWNNSQLGWLFPIYGKR